MTQVSGDDTLTLVETTGRRRHRDKHISKGEINNPALWTSFTGGRTEARDDMSGINMGMLGARKHVLRVEGNRSGKNNRVKT